MGGSPEELACLRLAPFAGVCSVFLWFFLVFLKICFLFLAWGAWPHRLFLNLGPFLGFVLRFLWFSLVVLGFGPWAWGLAWCFGARFWLFLFLFALVLTWFKLCMVPCHEGTPKRFGHKSPSNLDWFVLSSPFFGLVPWPWCFFRKVPSFFSGKPWGGARRSWLV